MFRTGFAEVCDNQRTKRLLMKRMARLLIVFCILAMLVIPQACGQNAADQSERVDSSQQRGGKAKKKTSVAAGDSNSPGGHTGGAENITKSTRPKTTTRHAKEMEMRRITIATAKSKVKVEKARRREQ